VAETDDFPRLGRLILISAAIRSSSLDVQIKRKVVLSPEKVISLLCILSKI
jgi:hypothetical protein